MKNKSSSMNKKAVIFLIIAVLITGFNCKKGAPDTGFIIMTQGTVLLNGKTVKTGEEVRPSDIIKTGDNSIAVIQFGDLALVTIKSNTILKIENVAIQVNKIGLRQENGTSFSKLVKKGSDFSIKTPTVVASVRGTSFTLSFDRNAGKTSISVLSGIVTLARSGEPESKLIKLENDIRIRGGEKADITPSTEIKPVGIKEKELSELKQMDSVDFRETKPDTRINSDKNTEPSVKKETTDSIIPKEDEAEKTFTKKLQEIKIKNNGKLDLIKLKDGRQIHGMIIERGQKYMIQTPSGNVTVQREDIVSQTITY
ncbi:MAG: FecR domain-containing protein [Spirochaetes bacterium]|nr:FecR domain-containing protein [Spirochaetota bacterium]